MKIDQLKGGAALSYITIFLTNAVGLLLTPFIIRSLGSAEYGLYTMIGALVGYISILDFGLNNTVVRFIAKYQAEENTKEQENFLAHSFILYACISSLVIIFGYVLYFNLDNLYDGTLTNEQLEKAKIMMLILIFNLAFSIPGSSFAGICYGYEIFILPKVTKIIRYIIRSILVVFILIYGGDSISLVVLDTILNIVIVIVDIYIVFKILKVRIKLHFLDKKLLRTTLNFSVWLFVFSLVHQLRWQFGQMIIGLYYSTSIVAIYAVGITLGNYYGAFSSAVSSVFLPKAIKMTVKNIPSEELTNTFIKISRIILIILFYIFGGFIIVGKDFVFFWVGEEYISAYKYAIVIMIGLTPILSQGFANSILEAKNLLAYRGKILLGLTLIGSILSFVIVKRFGVTEMIVNIVFFMLLERVFMFFYYNKMTNLNMVKYYKGIAPLFYFFLVTTTSIFFLVKTFLPEKNLVVFISVIIGYSISYIVFSNLVLNEYEKTLIKNTLKFLPFINSKK